MRILVVEDEPLMRRYLKKGLEAEGHAVEILGEGTGAAQAALRGEWELVILDVMLPGPDGYAILAEIRSAGSKVPVLMLTARGAPADRVRGLDAGADDYLCKPFDFSELLARARALARREWTGARGACLAVGDLRLDPAARALTRGGEPVALTSKEYLVLECLMRQPGRVFSRGQIASYAWDLEKENDSNIIDVYIRNLRRKVDEGRAVGLIRTHRGFGYSVAAEEG